MLSANCFIISIDTLFKFFVDFILNFDLINSYFVLITNLQLQISTSQHLQSNTEAIFQFYLIAYDKYV